VGSQITGHTRELPGPGPWRERRAHLALGDGAQRVDDIELGRQVGDLAQKIHGLLDRGLDHLVLLASALREHEQRVVELLVVAAVVAELDERASDLLGRGVVAALTRLLLELEQALDRECEVAVLDTT